MELKVISSNIRFENPKDLDHDWPYRKDYLASLINHFSSDLLGTQEGRAPQLEELKGLLRNMEMASGHRTWIKERMYPTIFYSPNRIELLESGDIWLSKTPDIPGSFDFDSAFPRLCTWMKGRLKKSSHYFFFVNVHLDHVKEETRKEQILVLTKECLKINLEKYPVILSGDFNDPPQGQVRQIINKEMNFLYDPWLEKNLQEESSYHKFQGDYKEGSRIDWILLDKSLKTKEIILDKSHQKGIYPSDHFPLKLRLSF